MKKIRVFQAFKTTNPAPRRQSAGSKRRIVPGLFPKNLGTILLFLLMLPYLITFLFGNLREGGRETSDWGREEGSYEGAYFVNNTTALGNESIPLEIYVADRLTRSMDEDFEMEAAKAQAVLIRSGLMAFLYEQGENLGNRREIQVTDEGYGSMPATKLAVQAVSQTKGVCLMYQNRPVSGAYFAVSNGATRNGEELSLTDYPYLKSVLCSRDFLSADYASQVSLRKNEFDRLWQEVPAIKNCRRGKICHRGNAFCHRVTLRDRGGKEISEKGGGGAGPGGCQHLEGQRRICALCGTGRKNCDGGTVQGELFSGIGQFSFRGRGREDPDNRKGNRTWTGDEPVWSQ